MSHYEKSEEYYEDGKYDLAVTAFSKAIQLDPDDASAYHERGASYADLGQYQTAIADFTKAIQLEPDNPDSQAAERFVQEVVPLLRD